MRHQIHGKKLNRSTAHRKAMYHNMVQSLVDHERITTTLVKAKAVRPVVEKLITRAKMQNLASQRSVIAFMPTRVSANKVITLLAPRFSCRPGGYTRIIKIGRRIGDGADMAVLEFVELSKPSAVVLIPAAAKKAVATKKTGSKSSVAPVSGETKQDAVETTPTAEEKEL